jgi:tetratricopeptide (TPR) repeat protein
LTRAKEHLGEAEKLTDRQHSPQEWASVEEAIANVLLMQGQQLDQAEKIIRSVIDLRNQIYGPQHRETLRSRRRLAWCLHRQGKNEEAEREYRELIKADEKIFGPEDRETIRSHTDLAIAMTEGYGYGQHITDPEKALAEYRSLLKLYEKVLGPENPGTLVTHGNLINILDYSGQYRESIAQRRELLPVIRKVLGPEDVNTAIQLENLGTDLAQVGEFREAEPMLREAYRLCEKTRGAADDITMGFRGNVVTTLVAQNKLLEAEKEARDMVNLRERTVGAERSASSREVVGIVLHREGRYSEAEAQIRQALHAWEKLQGPNGNNTREARGRLAIALWHQEKNAEAESVLRELIAVNEKVLEAQAYSLGENIRGRLNEEELALKPLQSRTLLANTLRDQGKYAEAEAEYKQVIQIEEKVLGPENFDTLDACYNYAYQLAQQGKRNEAKALAERAAKSALKILGANDTDTREYTKFLEILNKGQPIPTPYMKFHDSFWVGKET